MRKLYDIFVYSGFRTFPHEIMNLPKGEREMILSFFDKAIEEKKIPLMLCNYVKK